MNGDATTKCGYAGSDMVGMLDKNDSNCKITATGENSTLDTIYEEYIKPDFEEGTSDGQDHVIEYRNLLTKDMDPNRTNRFGVTSGNTDLMGASSNWAWYPRKLDLMSEMNVYGG